MAQINKTTAGIMLAAVIGGGTIGAIGASAIPAMAADGTGTSSSSTAAPDGYGTGTERPAAARADRTRPTARQKWSSPATPPRRSRRQ